MTNFKDKVIYQIYPKSFQDSNYDGIGDLNGIICRLDYLKNLGVDYLWITPFFPSPQRDNGYDVADYCAVEPRFGTMEDFETLVAEAEKREIGIMLDMVFNHTSTEHRWFKKALEGDEKYQKYYVFRDGKPDKLPTNWESKFGGPAWEYEEHLNKYYLHLFDTTQADLNWDNPEVREELKNVIRFWKEKGVKGFRFDVVNLISKPELLEDDLLGDGRRFYTDGSHVHEYLKELVADTGIEDMVTVGEMSSTTLDHCIRYSNPEENELSMCFNFHHLKIDYKNGNKWEIGMPDYKRLKELFQEWQEGMQEKNGWNALFWCNHDQPRIVSRLGDEQKYWKESAKLLAGMIHLMRGTPYIYQGEELGMTNAHYTSIEQYRDVESLNYYDILIKEGRTKQEVLDIIAQRSRDNGRTPMQWSSGEYAGFSIKEPWLALPENYQKINVENEEKDPCSILNFYKKLIQIRKEKKTIAEGTIAFTDTPEDQIIIYTRNFQKDEIVVFCNLSSEAKKSEVFQKWSGYKFLLGNYENEENIFSDKNEIVLRPYELIVLAND